MLPSLRINSSVVVFDVSNAKLLADIHEEFSSLVYSWKEFVEGFLHHVRSREYGAIHLSAARKKQHDVDVLDWDYIKKSREFILAYIKRHENDDKKKIAKQPKRRPQQVDSNSSSDEEDD